MKSSIRFLFGLVFSAVLISLVGVVPVAGALLAASMQEGRSHLPPESVCAPAFQSQGGAAIDAAAEAAEFIWTAEGDQASAYFGRSVASAGDVNGDGYDDVIVGAYLFDNGQTDEGRAFVYHGSASGLSTTPDWTAESDMASAYFGYSAGTAGDVNGDGYDDVIISAPRYGGSFYKGRVYVYFGSTGGLSVSPSWTVDGTETWGEFGCSVGSAGDVNGDGYDDVIVGAYKRDNGQSDEGQAYVYHGSAGSLSTTPDWTAESNQGSAYFGYSVGTAGDVNGDGYADVIVGAYQYDNGESNEGQAFVYCGSASGLSTTPNWTAESDQADAYFGYSVGTAGDVDGDSYDDVIVGAYTYDNGEGNEGRAYLFQGSSVGLNAAPSWTAESDQVSAYFGYSVGTAGDVNADGYADVVVGAYQYDHGQSDEGRAYAYLGSGAGLGAIASWTADIDQASAYFGCSLATAGDVNDDSCADIIVGAYSYDNGESNEGRAYAYHGSVSGLPPTPPIYVPDDYPTITAALAGSSPGDTIIVRDGTYTESVTVSTDNLTIRSENGPETTAVQAPSTSSDVFTIRAEDVTISGFTVTGASALGSIGIEIYPWDATNCSIIGNIILSNYYGIQGALDSDCATIKDNHILSSSSYGIWLHDTDNNTITGNTMLSNAHGIDMWNSSNNSITNNTISGSAQGIMLSFSGSGNTIASNHISSCTQWGIEAGNDGGNVVSQNTISNSETGIGVGKLASGGGQNIVTGNTLLGNDTGISVSGGTNQVTRNTILDSTGRGIRVVGSAKTDFDNLIDTTNTVNGKPVYYYYDQSGLVLDGLDAGHLTLAYCLNFTVRNSSISSGDGVYLRCSDGNSFDGNVMSLNSEDGACLVSSHNNTIRNNTLSSNRRDGIYLSASDGNQIIGNTVNNNTDGIWLWDYSDGNLITGNTALTNDGIGIYLRYSDTNTITGNIASYSTKWGIYLFWGCDYNLVYHNNVIGNAYSPQAGDYSNTTGTNSWDNGVADGGNYWSDHVCTGNPSDGSQPYYIEGDAAAMDRYPFHDLNGWASGSPLAVTTLPAADLMLNSATLNGILMSLGSASSAQMCFEWGLTSSYGNETAPETMNGPGLFSTNISGLLPGTTYHFRAKAVGDETALGDDVTFTTPAITPPILLYPADGRITNDNTPWLDWTDVTDPPGLHYQLEVDNDSDFSSPVVSKTWITLSSTTSPALPDGAYYWRVRAADGVGNMSDWTAAWSFTVDTTTPTVPDLLYPTDGKITKDNTPWLDWSDVTDPSGVQYQVQVDNDADFSSPVVSKSGLAASSRTLSTLPDGTYYWRVRAVDGAGNSSAWTTAWAFTVDTATPSMPVLLYPTDGKVTKDNTPWLDWSDVTDATGVKYQLQVDDNADFSSPVLNKTGMTASSRTLGTLADGTFCWRVRAVDGAGNSSAWTAAWSFTVDTVTPSVPTLLYPANGTVTTDTTPWLDWSDVTDATGVKYQLQVDNNADFSSPVVNKSGLTVSSRTLGTLSAGTYYWRVRAVDGAGNASAWTAAWSFVVT